MFAFSLPVLVSFVNHNARKCMYISEEILVLILKCDYFTFYINRHICSMSRIH
jgi:hypothetical protein